MSDRPKQSRVITVRMNPYLHAALRDEARGFGISVNALCLLKLEQALNPQTVPPQRWQRICDELKRLPNPVVRKLIEGDSLESALNEEQDERRREILRERLLSGHHH